MELIAGHSEEAVAFPGIIFNYTQPAEDAVDEAETGLKSSLAVKIFGTDLATLEDEGKVREGISKVRGITDITLVRELGQPSLIIEPDRATHRSLRLERERRQYACLDRHRAARRRPR